VQAGSVYSVKRFGMEAIILPADAAGH